MRPIDADRLLKMMSHWKPYMDMDNVRDAINKNYLDSCLAKSNARISEEVQSLLTEALRLEALKDGKDY